MVDTAHSQQAPDAKEIGNALLLAASGVRKKLISRLDARLQRLPLLNYANENEVRSALGHAARSVHPDLDVLEKELGRFLVLGPDSLTAKHLQMLARAGFRGTAARIGKLHTQRSWTAELRATVRQHPTTTVLAAMVVGYVVGRVIR